MSTKASIFIDPRVHVYVDLNEGVHTLEHVRVDIDGRGRDEADVSLKIPVDTWRSIVESVAKFAPRTVVRSVQDVTPIGVEYSSLEDLPRLALRSWLLGSEFGGFTNSDGWTVLVCDNLRDTTRASPNTGEGDTGG